MTQQINRRTVTKGIAWSVPAVALASAAPAFAASPIVTVDPAYNACKLPGGSCSIKKGYAMVLPICVTADDSVTFTFSNVTMTLGNGTPQSASIQPVTLNENGCHDVPIYISGEPNSQNVSISISGTYTWTTTEADGTPHSGSGTLTGSSPDSPPCTDCDPRLPTSSTTDGTNADSTQTTSADDAAPATVEEPVTDATVEEPVTDATVEEPVVETTVEEPVVETTVEEPVLETEVVGEATN